MMDEHRLIEIETRIAYQEVAQRELSDALIHQQQEIDRLQRLCISLQRSLTDLAASSSARPTAAEERPPHY